MTDNLPSRTASPWYDEFREPLVAFVIASVFITVLTLLNPSPSSELATYDFPAESGEYGDADKEPKPELAGEDSDNSDNSDNESTFEGELTSEDELTSETETAALETEPAVEPWLEYRIRRNDTMARVLQNIGADEEALDYLLKQKFKTYRRLRRGDYLQFRLDDSRRLSELRYKTSPEYYFWAGRDENGWSAQEAPPVLVTVTRATGGTIDSTLFESADEAGFSESGVNALIIALETHIDFYRDLRENDSFRAVYTETTDEDGKPSGDAELLAFEYVSLRRPDKPRVIRGALAPNGGYYSAEGESMQGAFLRAPLKFRRISSRFTHRRFHPVLKRWRPHRGVDYAARSGTPVRTTADGEVTKVEKQRGYGNVIMIRHLNIYTTVYAHLRGFAKGMRRGKKVQQGDVIGYVGSTGLSTGPHLHYEFRVRGKHKDPLSEAVPRRLPPLKAESLEEFKAHSAPFFAQLDAISVN